MAEGDCKAHIWVQAPLREGRGKGFGISGGERKARSLGQEAGRGTRSQNGRGRPMWVAGAYPGIQPGLRPCLMKSDTEYFIRTLSLLIVWLGLQVST